MRFFAKPAARIALRIALIYAVFGGIWILFSDQAMGFFLDDRELLIEASIYKGWFYVAITSILLYFLVLGSTSRYMSQQAYLRNLLDHIPDMVWVKDENGVYLSCNPPSECFLGAREADIVGHTDYDLVSREQADSFCQHDKKAIASKIPLKNEEWLVFADGQRVLFETIKRPLLDENGRLLGVLGIGRDITALHQAQENLRQELARSQSYLDTVEAIIIALDSEGNVTLLNRKGCKLLGWQPEELVGRSWFEHCLPSPEGTQKVLPVFKALLAGETELVEYFENDVVTRTGERRMIAWHNVAYRDSEGRITGVLSAGEDITMRRIAEAERLRLESKLLQAQRLESVGRLAGGVAHDYNNMLSVIIGYAELAMGKTAASESLKTDLQEILKAAQRSAAITRQLLAFSRQQTIEPHVLDLNKTIESMLKMLRPLIGEDIDLLWKPCLTDLLVKMDTSQIDQILANLCVNARDAISGIGKITIETNSVTLDDVICSERVDCAPGEYVMLAVSDDGCGMERDLLANIFEPFFSTKKVGHGTGLGLATVYGIVKQNNGLINVYSEPGKGATFKIYLPAFSGSMGEIKHPDSTDVPLSRGETVLIVEDEASILQLTARVLEELGYNVLSAGTPGEALRLAKDHLDVISLLLIDVIMPEMTGRELSGKLCELCPDLKILYMSGYTADVIAHRGILDDGVHFVQKPFSMKELAGKVRNTIDS
ncbi:MAG TPA: PAS domain-containing sensor histidine kinase [Candidatus Riflebacteria bacterium]|nr:PAS domain-containing sensor histidine kinase [Candidatus Riflebacteria bacterium]